MKLCRHQNWSLFLQAEAMAGTVGQHLRPLAELPDSEVKVADEKHNLTMANQSEEVRIVLTRPLVAVRSEEILQVCNYYYRDTGYSSKQKAMYRL